MKSKPFSLSTAPYKSVFQEVKTNISRQRLGLFLTCFIPLLILPFLMDWQPQILVFIFLGYASAWIGYMLARTMIIRDKLLMEEDQLYRKMVNHLSYLVIVHRMEDHSNVFVSPAVQEIAGYSPKEIMCKYVTFIIYPEDRKQIVSYLKMEYLKVYSSFQTTLRIQKKDGTLLWMELTGKAIKAINNEVTHTLLYFRDVSEQMEIEKTTRHFAEELMKRKMTVQSAFQNDDMATVFASHDLKEPLRTVISYVNLLEQKHSHNLADTGKECIKYIKENAERMTCMLDDVLTFSAMMNQSPNNEYVEIQELVNNVLLNLQHKISNVNALITYEGLPKVNADEIQLRRLFQNLIENALKYRSSSDPFIAVTWEKLNGFWKFGVHDNGIGIAQEFQKDIFNIFRRLHPQGHSEGTGIGLTICKKIVINHGGEIWVESQGIGKGSSFYFTIPVHARTVSLPIENNNLTKTMKMQLS